MPEYRQIAGTVILDRRFYVCRRNPPVSIVDQPMRGWPTRAAAQEWLDAIPEANPGFNPDLFVVVAADEIERV